MNPGMAEEAGSTARALIGALAGNPAVLALSVINLAMLVFFYIALKSSAEYRTTLTDQVLSNSNAIHDILKSRAIGCPEGTQK